MIRLQFPKDKISVRQRLRINEVFDVIRKKWVRLTPEEWVRQNMIHYLLEKKFPSSHLSVEKEIKLGELSKRCDIVVYDLEAKPFMIIECKEMETALSEKVLGQVLRYHLSLPAKYLVISNGTYCFGYKKINEEFIEISEFPAWQH
ncbi:MAG TPA: type I restriction enzyme HsdR N-terminal domain-containing protein [Chitinophagaceae bacterium]|nr:type I restriction enzyme HsdR N-terminal domain-containing protein [Chitinophagaceae bacterium]